MEGCRHGTHVAGIAAGRGSAFSGVARDAGIVSVQVFSRFPRLRGPCSLDECARAYESDVIRALDHVRTIAAARHVAAVNVSLGSGYYTAPCDTDSAKVAIDELLAIGVPTVVASGNDYAADAVAWPACISTAVTVGASTDTAEKVANFTDMSSVVDLLAPGSVITSSVPGGGFAAMEGTSMAAPTWPELSQRFGMRSRTPPCRRS